MVRLYRVILPVSSIEKAAEFYSSVFELEGTRVSPGRHYFNCGGTILACFDPQADGDQFEASPNPDHVYFSVNNLETVHETISQFDGVSVGEIKVQPWGERCFYVVDPFGNPLCFVDERTLFIG